MKKDLIYKTFSRIPELETERLVLRKLRASDSEDMFEYAKREDSTRYLTWSAHPSERYTRGYIEYVEKHYAIGNFFDWAIVDKASGKMIGTCGFTRLDAQNDAGEIGYVLNPDFWGLGLATEAAGRVVAFGFDKLSLNRIEARFMNGNNASRRVMEKIGMRFEGTHLGAMLIKGKYRDISVCAITRADYEKAREKSLPSARGAQKMC